MSLVHCDHSVDHSSLKTLFPGIFPDAACPSGSMNLSSSKPNYLTLFPNRE